MSQVEMRAELVRRGLVNYGANHDVRTRLQNDEARGVFKGNLADMSDEYLREGCKLRSIPSRSRRSVMKRKGMSSLARVTLQKMKTHLNCSSGCLKQ